MNKLDYGPNLNDQERAELDAMYALMQQNLLAYVNYCKRRGITRSDGSLVENWYQRVDDPGAQGWQSALNSMFHTFGSVRGQYESIANLRASKYEGELPKVVWHG
jgi:hypothetical protein